MRVPILWPQPKRKTNQSSTALILVAIALLTTLSVAWLLAQKPVTALADLEPSPSPVLVPVRTGDVNYATDAVASGRLVPSGDLLASPMMGTVTDISITAGTVLENGQELYRVNNQPIFAYVSDTALYRDLTIGDKGPDVQIAQDLLNVLTPVSTKTDGAFGSQTERAVKALRREYFGEATEQSGTFPFIYFVRVPHTGAVVQDVSLTIGAPSAAPGDAIATLAPRVDNFALQTTATSLPNGAYTFTYEGIPVPLVRADQTWPTEAPAELMQLMLAAHTMDEGAELSLEGRVALTNPIAGTVVPASAILVSARDGTYCVATTTDGTTQPVELLSDNPDGTAVVTSQTAQLTQVLANPTSAGVDRCR